jgi:glycosyltransferase involved in cell wall biosynthesis
LRYFDAIIFHSKKYRDFRYVKNLRLKKLFFIPNGADNKEFASPSGSFRELFKIKEESKLLLTVGSLNPLKGHYDVAYAFSLIKYKSDVILVLNGNQQNKKLDNFTFELLRQLKKIFSGNFKLFAYLKRIFFKKNLLKLTDEINSGKFGYNKKVIILDMDRKNLINCYFDADLFVFASNIEYSPLVLFEAAAARLPFLTINVGNASEIIRWTRGGVLSNSEIDKDFFVHADVIDMAKKIDLLLLNSKKLNRLGQLGRKSHIKIYNWDNIFKLYNRIFVRLFNTKPRIFKK